MILRITGFIIFAFSPIWVLVSMSIDWGNVLRVAFGLASFIFISYMFYTAFMVGKPKEVFRYTRPEPHYFDQFMKPIAIREIEKPVYVSLPFDGIMKTEISMQDYNLLSQDNSKKYQSVLKIEVDDSGVEMQDFSTYVLKDEYIILGTQDAEIELL